ncbi:hypothetical protein MLD38_018655 [Melastoma candidum]|uniref:Uncharacterized protein n=1 Tax=Melastoma candidum TaxID=119954 RepID=A0ACB9QUF2_9MYRT|nr:hypothetical protein MLD38_018655 [Melastoma candidum]
MNRMRPVYTRQHSNTGTPGTPMSPARSPATQHHRAGSMGNAKKAQTKAAAQRLAQVMAHQYADDDVEDDDLSYDYTPAGSVGGIGLAGGRGIRPRSPMTVRPYQDLPQSIRSGSGIRTSVSAKPAEQPPSAHGRTSDYNMVEPSLPPVRPNISIRSSQASNMEQPPSARSSLSGRPFPGVKSVPVMPASVPISLKPAPSSLPPDSPIENRLAERRLSSDWESMSFRDNSSQRSASALQDEYDMLQEENDQLLEKLRVAEEKFDEAEARAKQLEQQISTLGEGVTLESRLLSRKEAALQQREAALRMASQSRGRHDEIAALRIEAETAKEKLYEVQVMTQLSKEEMDEVVMKRCWLARYWSLCLHHGIHAEIAEAKKDYWSSFTPSPADVVLAAGQKAKEENSFQYDYLSKGENSLLDIPPRDEVIDIESMLLAEKGLRELALLKVEDGIMLAMALQRRRGILKSTYEDNAAEEAKLRMEGQIDATELNQEESEDLLFKQAWLMYFWRRAKNHEVEVDIADERLQFWINQSTKTTATLHDAVDVERGLMELRKLGIDDQLWQMTRRGHSQDGSAIKTGNEF